jgi:hypothetical protein
VIRFFVLLFLHVCAVCSTLITSIMPSMFLYLVSVVMKCSFDVNQNMFILLLIPLLNTLVLLIISNGPYLLEPNNWKINISRLLYSLFIYIWYRYINAKVISWYRYINAKVIAIKKFLVSMLDICYRIWMFVVVWLRVKMLQIEVWNDNIIEETSSKYARGEITAVRFVSTFLIHIICLACWAGMRWIYFVLIKPCFVFIKPWLVFFREQWLFIYQSGRTCFKKGTSWIRQVFFFKRKYTWE